MVKLNLKVSVRFEKHHLDDILLGFLLVFIGLAVDPLSLFRPNREGNTKLKSRSRGSGFSRRR